MGSDPPLPLTFKLNLHTDHKYTVSNSIFSSDISRVAVFVPRIETPSLPCMTQDQPWNLKCPPPSRSIMLKGLPNRHNHPSHIRVSKKFPLPPGET